MNNFYVEKPPQYYLVTEQPPSLRDRFAMAALTGMLADPGIQVGGSIDKITAKLCYGLADAMMQARSDSKASEIPTTNSSQ